jgi:hypothetical protein
MYPNIFDNIEHMTNLVWVGILLSLSVEANMYLKAGVNKLTKVNSQAESHCHPQQAGDRRNLQTRQEIEFEVTCKYKCRKDQETTETIKRILDTTKERLTRGDGSGNTIIAYGSFTATLEIWAQRMCLKLASDRCQNDISNIKNIDTISIKNDKWQTPYQIQKHCDTESVVDSRMVPYKTERKGSREYHPSNAILSNTNRRLVDSNRPSNYSTDKNNPHSFFSSFNYESIKIKYKDEDVEPKCKKWIKGTVCYGDCVSMTDFNSNELKMMTSTQGFAVDEIKICADELENAFKKLRIRNKKVKKTACNIFFFKTLISQEVRGSSCSAFRGTTNC